MRLRSNCQRAYKFNSQDLLSQILAGTAKIQVVVTDDSVVNYWIDVLVVKGFIKLRYIIVAEVTGLKSRH